MGRVLALTSPHTQGADVRHLQEALKTNAFVKDFMPSAKPDADFGILTAQAVYRAEYWLGYAKPVQFCGTPLPRYLRGELSLTTAMQDKRKARIALHAAAAPLRIKAFKEALTHVGVKESPPGSNMQQFGKWYGMNGRAWCAMFVSYCEVAAGSKSFAKGSRYAYCPYVVADARAGSNNLTITRHPQQGDIALYDWDNDGIADHIEFFDKWIVGTTRFASLGGNTSPTDASNGGQVYHYGAGNTLSRSVNDVICFVHVGK